MELEFTYFAGENAEYIKDAFNMQRGEKIHIPKFGEATILNAVVSDDGQSVNVFVDSDENKKPIITKFIF